MNQIQNWLQNSILFSLILLTSTPVYGQIDADDTLGTESSRLTPNVSINGATADQIDGGALRGSNLFHSFTQFNINDGQRVYFSNPTGVQNILTRVTGGQGSNIFGTLGVAGNANLFLINPNGIVVGKHAQLDIRGAFTATTANSLLFPNGVEFSATNPQAPPILTINVPIGLQFGSQPGSITSQAFNPFYVGTGSTLAFMGGEIALDGSFLFGSNGQVKLGAVDGDTTVGLNVNGSSLGFNLPENSRRASINFMNGRIAATGANSGIELLGGKIALNGNSSYLFSSNGGAIFVDANQLNLDNGAGIVSATTGVTKGGDIQIQASDAVTLTNSSRIFANSNANATGAGGNVTINAEKIAIIGDGTPTNSSGISTLSTGKGNGGNLTFNATNSLNVDGGFILVSTNGIGNGGNLTVRATDAVDITNQATLGIGSLSSGSTGNLRIETGTLRLQNNLSGRGVTALTSGSGSVGSISILARNAVEVTQSNITTQLVLPLGSQTSATAGDITIETQRVNLKDGGYISTDTSSSANASNIFIKASGYADIRGASSGVFSRTVIGSGNSGNITIETPRLSLTQGGEVSTTSTNSSGNAGNITIRAKDVEMDGFVFVPKEQFLLYNPAAEEILSNPGIQEILSRFGGLFYMSDLTSDVIGSNADARGGTINIDTERLRLSNGGNISTSVFAGRGQGGNLVVRATDSIDITGVGTERLDGSFQPSGLFAELQAGGISFGGSIDVTTGHLNLTNQGEISAGTFNQGNGGNVTINASQINLSGNTKITTGVSSKATGNAGNISIKTQLLNVQEESEISSATFGNGDGGNLTVKADRIILTGSDSELLTGITSSVQERANGQGGNIDITTNNLDIRDNAEISSGSMGKGEAGNIKVSANFLEIFGKGSAIASVTNVGNGGNIILEIGDLLLLRRGGFISTTAGRAQAGGNGGNITINSPFIIAVANEDSDIFANAFTGKGGNVNINTQAIFGIAARPKPTNQSDITASSQLGVQGQITISQPQVQPPQKLLELPTGLVDASSQIAQTCPRSPNAKPLSSFVVTGRGSLPPTSLEPLTGTTSLNSLASLDGENADIQADAGTQRHKYAESSLPITEAQGLVKTADGKIALVAQAPTATPAATTATTACVTSP